MRRLVSIFLGVGPVMESRWVEVEQEPDLKAATLSFLSDNLKELRDQDLMARIQ